MKKFEVEFYERENGEIPVEDFLNYEDRQVMILLEYYIFSITMEQ